MAVEAYVGLWGGGKTLALVERCVQRQEEGYEIVSNFGFKGGRIVHTLEEVLEVLRSHTPGGKDRVYLALDEAGMLFPAREYSKWPAALNALMMQGRKYGIDLGYTTQAFEFVDTNLRRVTGLVTVCTGFGKVRVSPKGEKPAEYRPWLFVRSTYLGREYGSAKAHCYRRRMTLFKPEIAARYDTYEVIAAAQRVLGVQASEVGAST